MSSWRPSLRIAWRDALRSRARSVLVLVMIALPVLGVTAAAVVVSTSEVSGTEALERRLGTADARIDVNAGAGRVFQMPDPNDGSGWTSRSRKGKRAMPSLADVEQVLGRDVRAVELADGWSRYDTDRGVDDLELLQTDLADPLVDGLFLPVEGRLPRTTDEVMVNPEVAERGPGIGDELVLRGGTTRTVVGIAEDASNLASGKAWGLPGAFDDPQSGGRHVWLVEAGDVTWPEVRALNEVGAMVLSRAVLAEPPPESELHRQVQSWGQGGVGDEAVAVVVLVVVMALLEVVLLAGPAFAVSARRQSRVLALMAATGGTPAQGRRVVLAGGLVLGTVAALLGVVLGVVVGWAVLPVVQRFSDSRLGPFEVPWPYLAGVAAFGLASAVLAAVVPAWIASRQDVVAVLAGRRGDRAPNLRSPAVGVLALAAGVAAATYGATASQNGEYVIAAAAVVSVLAMILLVPVVVVGLARLSGRLPLVLRYAVRDAARHRTRTVPAVAAVAATVAGVVTLGIAVTSDEAENEATYVAALPIGSATLTDYGRSPDWQAHESLLRRELPAAGVLRVPGVPENQPGGWASARMRSAGGEEVLLSSWGSTYGASLLVSDGGWPEALDHLSDEVDTAAAERVLSQGGVVVFTDHEVAGDEVTVRLDQKRRGEPLTTSRARLPAAYVARGAAMSGPQAILSREAADRLGAETSTVGLLVSGAEITDDAEQAVGEVLTAGSGRAGLFVERGYQAQDETVIVLLVLGALGAVLMLGGTLTATFLALSDARPDLATLSAVGASPRTRRGVAAAYALVVGVVGAVLGAAVGFVPGVAISYPLTRGSWLADLDPSFPSHFLDVPWLLVVALVIGLPLLTAAIVGATARSRLPLVSRLG